MAWADRSEWKSDDGRDAMREGLFTRLERPGRTPADAVYQTTVRMRTLVHTLDRREINRMPYNRSFRAGLLAGMCCAIAMVHLAVAQPSLPRLDSPCLLAQASTSPPTTSPPTTGGPASAEELAKKLSNPIASLISVPFQSNFDFNTGQGNDKFKYTLNIQPVIPLSIGPDWNLISRIIQPVIYQDELFPGMGSKFGLGDMNPSFFFSPKEPFHGWIWGVGPVLLLPTATDDALGTGKWGAGPTAVGLRQHGPWTYGLLANHLWSFAGEGARADVNQTFLQPFLAHNSKSGFGVTLMTESSYNWEAEQWTVPLGLFASQVLKLGGQPLSLQFGPRVYVDGPSGGPEWGLRFNVVLLFPKS
jgi:hypothetical protein